MNKFSWKCVSSRNNCEPVAQDTEMFLFGGKTKTDGSFLITALLQMLKLTAVKQVYIHVCVCVYVYIYIVWNESVRVQLKTRLLQSVETQLLLGGVTHQVPFTEEKVLYFHQHGRGGKKV